MSKKILLVGIAVLAMAVTSHADMGLVLAQAGGGAGNLDSALGKGMGIISKIVYVIAFAAMGVAGYRFMKGDVDTAKMGFVGAVVMALANYIISALWAAAGNPVNIQIQ